MEKRLSTKQDEILGLQSQLESTNMGVHQSQEKLLEMEKRLSTKQDKMCLGLQSQLESTKMGVHQSQEKLLEMEKRLSTKQDVENIRVIGFENTELNSIYFRNDLIINGEGTFWTEK